MRRKRGFKQKKVYGRREKQETQYSDGQEGEVQVTLF